MNNESILQNKVLRKYKLELSKLISYLKNDLHDLEIKTALVYGSSTYNDVFIEGVSDIDIIAYTDKLETISPKEIIEIVKKTKINFKDKEPTIYVDHIGYRIEFYIKLPTISFDITLLPYTIPNFNKKETDASYDSLEMLIGALYENSIVLFGKRPMEDIVQKEFYPFYSESLRKKRLKVITERLEVYNERVYLLTKNRDRNLIDHLYKTRNLFLKWLFIYKRKYPVNLSKHIDYQLKKLDLNEKETMILEFLSSKGLFEASSQYIKLSEKYIKEYKLEEKIKK